MHFLAASFSGIISRPSLPSGKQKQSIPWLNEAAIKERNWYSYKEIGEHIWCTWKFSVYIAHIKSTSFILDLTSLIVWYILLRTPFDVVGCSGGSCYFCKLQWLTKDVISKMNSDNLICAPYQLPSFHIYQICNTIFFLPCHRGYCGN